MVGIDGTKFFGSNNKSCTECLKNTKGQKTHNFHSGAVMSTVGIGPKLVIGFEMYKPGKDSVSKDEGELNVAKRLISSVVKSHRNLVDVVVYDALACNSIWINHCKDLGINAVVRTKNNNNRSLRSDKSKVNKSEAVDVWEDEKGFEKVEVYESTFTMDNVEQPLRFVKFALKHKNKQRTQIMIVTTCIDMALKTLFKIIRARWDIENSIFNNLKTECGLEHCLSAVLICSRRVHANGLDYWYSILLKSGWLKSALDICLISNYNAIYEYKRCYLINFKN